MSLLPERGVLDEWTGERETWEIGGNSSCEGRFIAGGVCTETGGSGETEGTGVGGDSTADTQEWELGIRAIDKAFGAGTSKSVMAAMVSGGKDSGKASGRPQTDQ